MSLVQWDAILSPGETKTKSSRMLLPCDLISCGEGRLGAIEEMEEGAHFLLPRRSMTSSSAWQRDGCTGCSSIRSPQSDYKDTKDLSALKKDKRDAEFTLHPSFPHWADRGLFGQGLWLVNSEQVSELRLFPTLCDTPWRKCFQSAFAEPLFYPVIIAPAAEPVNRLTPTQHIPAPAAQRSALQVLQQTKAFQSLWPSRHKHHGNTPSPKIWQPNGSYLYGRIQHGQKSGLGTELCSSGGLLMPAVLLWFPWWLILRKVGWSQCSSEKDTKEHYNGVGRCSEWAQRSTMKESTKLKGNGGECKLRECKKKGDERQRAGARPSGTYTVIPKAISYQTCSRLSFNCKVQWPLMRCSWRLLHSI